MKTSSNTVTDGTDGVQSANMKISSNNFDKVIPFSDIVYLSSLNSFAQGKEENQKQECHGNSINKELYSMLSKCMWACIR